MTGSDAIEQDLLRPLAVLRQFPKVELHYYARLATMPDPVMRVAAWRVILDARLMPNSLMDRVVADCVYPAVRSRAFDFFEGVFEHDTARRVAETEITDPEDAKRAYMLATLKNDVEALVGIEEQRFLANADAVYLDSAAAYAEQAHGWQAGLKATVRGLVAYPRNIQLIIRILRLIESASKPALASSLATLLDDSGLYPQVGGLARALGLLLSRQYKDSLALLPSLDGPGPFQGIVLRWRGECLHKIGDYRKSFAAYLAMNELDRASAKHIDAENYIKSTKLFARAAVPQLPPDERRDVTWLVGFPRSGTTLLENVLDAHPRVETFEEIPSLLAATTYVQHTIKEDAIPVLQSQEVYLAARARYYAELDRRRKKSTATTLVDKMPLRSADAAFGAKLLPNLRYVFSVRHPFDVVFSSVRQRFRMNWAMKNLLSVGEATRLYDFVMSSWFDVHSLADPTVFYVRYDELVTDFEPLTRRLLGFLDLEWKAEINDFAARASERSASTPSYQKVRQGLSIGVQTYWRNYDFLFHTPEAKPLHKWAEFFGYETK